MQALDIRLLIPGLSFDPTDPFAKSLGGSGDRRPPARRRASPPPATSSPPRPTSRTRPPGARSTSSPRSTFVSTQHGVPCDLAIAQRTPLAFANRSAAKVQMLWVHDLLFARRKNELNGVLHSIDRIVTVSRWQAEQYRRVEPRLPERLFLPLRNGLDLELIAQAREAAPKRERDLILCTARPERGIDVLLEPDLPRRPRAHPQRPAGARHVRRAQPADGALLSEPARQGRRLWRPGRVARRSGQGERSTA